MNSEELYSDGWAGKGETAADELHRAASDARKTMDTLTIDARPDIEKLRGEVLALRAELAALRAENERLTRAVESVSDRASLAHIKETERAIEIAEGLLRNATALDALLSDNAALRARLAAAKRTQRYHDALKYHLTLDNPGDPIRVKHDYPAPPAADATPAAQAGGE